MQNIVLKQQPGMVSYKSVCPLGSVDLDWVQLGRSTSHVPHPFHATKELPWACCSYGEERGSGG